MQFKRTDIELLESTAKPKMISVMLPIPIFLFISVSAFFRSDISVSVIWPIRLKF